MVDLAKVRQTGKWRQLRVPVFFLSLTLMNSHFGPPGLINSIIHELSSRVGESSSTSVVLYYSYVCSKYVGNTFTEQAP